MRKLEPLTDQEHQMLTEVMSSSTFIGKHSKIVDGLRDKLQNAEKVENGNETGKL